jgi:hypothetical protein
LALDLGLFGFDQAARKAHDAGDFGAALRRDASAIIVPCENPTSARRSAATPHRPEP